MERKFAVYCHTSPSGKRYVGITSQTIRMRWRNGYGYEKCPAMWSAIKKYGWRNFKHTVLKEQLTKEEAEAEEKRLIEEWNTFDERFGYNIQHGGLGANCGPRSAAVKEKMSKNHTGKKAVICIETQKQYDSIISAAKDTGLARVSIKKSCVTQRATVNNLHFTFKKSADAYIPKPAKTNGRERPVINMDTGEIFASADEAGRAIGVHGNSIRSVCGNKPHHFRSGGYRWAYLDSVEEAPKEVPAPQEKCVVCVETGELFQSAGNAARAKKVKCAGNIRRACKSNGKYRAGGFHWAYASEVIKTNGATDRQGVCDRTGVGDKEAHTRTGLREHGG